MDEADPRGQDSRQGIGQSPSGMAEREMGRKDVRTLFLSAMGGDEFSPRNPSD